MSTSLVKYTRKPPKIHEKGGRLSSPCGHRDRPYNTYLDNLNLRGSSPESEAMRLAIASSPDQRFRDFLARVTDPSLRARRTTHLAVIAKACGIGLQEFQDWMSKSLSAQATAAAQYASPRIVGYHALKSVPHAEGLCDRCDGLKWVFVDAEIDPDFIPGGVRKMTVYVKQMVEVKGKQVERMVPVTRHTRTCPLCNGTGVKPRSGDLDAAKFVAEVSGHVGKQAKIQINQNFGGASLDSRQEQLNKIPFDVEIEAEPQ